MPTLHLIQIIILLDTTDVQESSLQVDYVHNLVEANCIFILGSRARGCVLVLDGTRDNDVIRIARGDRSPKQYDSERLGDITFSLYDWEEDGSVGNVSVPVNIISITTDEVTLASSEGETSQLERERDGGRSVVGSVGEWVLCFHNCI